MKILTTLISSSLIILSSSYKIGVINDYHMNIYYDQTTSDNACWGSSPISLTEIDTDSNSSKVKNIQQAEPNAPMGRYGCDPPKVTFESMLKLLKKDLGNVDVLLIPGDVVAHGVPIDPASPLKGDYALLKEIIAEGAQSVFSVFPNTFVIPALGNNDYKYHYQAPYSDEKEEYLSFYYKQWFERSGTKNG